MVYKNCKVYGPYKRKDGREHVIIIFPNKKRKTVSYSKYLVEKYIDRYLEPDETIDHIDGNFTNNNFSNLQILIRSEHTALDVKRNQKQCFICPMCKTVFELEGDSLNRAIQNRKKGKAGPFCNPSCAGKYGAYIQNGYMEPLDVKEIKVDKISNKDKNKEKCNPISIDVYRKIGIK